MAISINESDSNNAYFALQCLSQISPIYLPFYAEIIRLRGDAAGAIDAYERYITQFPDDTPVQMKLATVYMANNSYASAELMLDYILTRTSDAKAAIDLKKQLAYHA